MNELVPHEGNLPAEQEDTHTTLGKRSVLVPKDSTDKPSTWTRFFNAARSMIGLKPIELTIRVAKAEVEKREAEVQVALSEGKANFEKVTAEADSIRAQGETEREEARSRKLDNDFKEMVLDHLKQKSIEEAAADFEERLTRMRGLYGGDIYIDEPEDGEDTKLEKLDE